MVATVTAIVALMNIVHCLLMWFEANAGRSCRWAPFASGMTNVSIANVPMEAFAPFVLKTRTVPRDNSARTSSYRLLKTDVPATAESFAFLALSVEGLVVLAVGDFPVFDNYCQINSRLFTMIT